MPPRRSGGWVRTECITRPRRRTVSHSPDGPRRLPGGRGGGPQRTRAPVRRLRPARPPSHMNWGDLHAKATTADLDAARDHREDWIASDPGRGVTGGDRHAGPVGSPPLGRQEGACRRLTGASGRPRGAPGGLEPSRPSPSGSPPPPPTDPPAPHGRERPTRSSGRVQGRTTATRTFAGDRRR